MFFRRLRFGAQCRGFLLTGPGVGVIYLLSVPAAAAAAAGFAMDGGPVDYQVFQRDENDHAHLPLAGTGGSVSGTVEARLLMQATGVPIAGFDWTRIGTAAANGPWESVLADVPVGGEYRLQVRLLDGRGGVRAAAPDVQHLLIGDLWVAAGQSNMIGRGRLGPDRETGIPQVHIFDCDYRWRQGEEPVTGKVTDRLALGKNWESDYGQHSPCLRFAKDLYSATGVPIGIVPTAIGGTGLSHWAKPAQPHPSGALTLYERALRMIRATGGRITGMLWWQGEGEPGSRPEQYLTPFTKLIADFRADLDDPDLPFLFAQLESTDAPTPDERRDERWTNKEEAFRLAEQRIPRTAMIVTIDLPRMDVHHLDTPALKVVGARFALAARTLVHEQTVPWSGPRFEAAQFTDTARRVVRVRFRGLADEVRPETGIKGFNVVADRREIPIESAARDRQDPAVVVLKLGEPAPAGARVRYGFGRNPEVSLTDAAGLPAAVFADQSIR